MKSKSRRDEMLADLEETRETVGHLPGIDAINEHSQYDLSEFVDEFGSLPAAMEAAGMEVDLFTRSSGLSKQQLISHLQEFADELGRKPTKELMASDGPHSPRTYQVKFGSWSDALEAAGFERHQKRIPDGDLDREFQRLTSDLGRPPTHREMDKHGRYSGNTYKSRFGSWKNTLEHYGYDPDANLRRVSDEEVLEAIRDLADELGRPPIARELNEQGDVSVPLTYKHFGSYTAALQAAGVLPDDEAGAEAEASTAED